MGVATQDCTAVDDDALLSEFVKNGDKGAFKMLAARHARWLYAAAFRHLRDRHVAEDATQAVFVLLWRRAGSVAGRRKVTGWLFRAVGYAARAMKRAERRRRKYESRAALGNRTPSDEPPPTLCRDVDAAVAALGEADRRQFCSATTGAWTSPRWRGNGPVRAGRGPTGIPAPA